MATAGRVEGSRLEMRGMGGLLGINCGIYGRRDNLSSHPARAVANHC